MAGTSEITLDLEEVRKLLEIAKRPRVVQVLTDRLREFEREVALAQGDAENAAASKSVAAHDIVVAPMAVAPSSPDANGSSLTAGEAKIEPSSTTSKSIGVKLPPTTFGPKISISYTPLSSFSWDQTTEHVKLYYSLQGVSSDGVDAHFTSTSFDVKIRHPDGKHYRCGIPNLNGPINANASSVIVRPKRIIIKLKKQDFGHWIDIYHKEDKFKASSESGKDDPMAGLMGMMKNLYDEGDDDMKRTIAKAFEESSKGGGLPSSSPSSKFDPLRM
ncbi:hypothetical protein CBR_g22260 [Chara braunii]|uniref:Calcyclin-binding protein n=1 Tax=Chara braunii TaxID=69332 RepID=A0A388L2P9_CHABU|nr:hypothetical protein CBR_g22260 [Chara braunii]|eukprot:GBG76512.1 hypothetical protein CBR_g22260 [Chara braunii]